MWKKFSRLFYCEQKKGSLLWISEKTSQPCRTTFILKRRHLPLLHKKEMPPKKLRHRHYIYDLVKDTNCEKQPEIPVILTSYISGLGNIGEKLTVKRNFAYKNLLLPGLAVYATPENLEKYKNFEQNKKVEHHSSPIALMTAGSLSRVLLSLVMNKHTSWTIEPWHVSTSFRKCGYIVPKEAIALPSEAIKGPDISLHGKQFLVTVTINKLEKAKVRCTVYHYSDDPAEKLPYEEKFYMKQPVALFPEEATIIEELHKQKLEAIAENSKS